MGPLEVNAFAFGKARSGGYPAIYIAGFVSGTYGIWICENFNSSSPSSATWTQLIDPLYGPWPMGSNCIVSAMEASKDVFGQAYVATLGTGAMYIEVP